MLAKGAAVAVVVSSHSMLCKLLMCIAGSTQLILISGANVQLGLSNEWFVLGDSVILTVLAQVRTVQACPGVRSCVGQCVMCAFLYVGRNTLDK